MDVGKNKGFKMIFKTVAAMVLAISIVVIVIRVKAETIRGKDLAKQLRQLRAEQQALINMQHPMRMATADEINYEIWKLTQARDQERVAITHKQ